MRLILPATVNVEQRFRRGTLAVLIVCAVAAAPSRVTSQQILVAARVTPSVVWCDEVTTVRVEVTIRNRTDVAAVELPDLQSGVLLRDDGANGDRVAGDNVFTGQASDVFCASNALDASSDGVISRSLGGRLVLKNGGAVDDAFRAFVGEASRSLRDAFPVSDLGDGLRLTTHALFIDDSTHKIFPSYPVAEIYDNQAQIAAARRLYSVLPDVYDMVILTPGTTIYDPASLVGRTPFLARVTNQVRHVGMPVDDWWNSAPWGSAGRLKGAVWLSFGSISVADHEVAHTWGAAIGRNLGLSDSGGHWEALTDIGGQLGSYYRKSDGRLGHFAHNGDRTWRWVPNSVNRPYAPLELYIMGLIGPEDVPPIHVLTSPDTTDLNRITAASVRTVTIQDIVQAEGGVRDPGLAASQKHFNVAYVVTQDEPYTDAHFAFFSQLSKLLMSRDAPRGSRACCFAPFHWATGGRATLTTEVLAPAGSLCGYVRTPSSATFASRGGIGSLGVTGGAHCAWTAVTNADSRDWITILRPTGRSQGAGNVVYAVKANTGAAARRGTLTIAGAPFEVVQQRAATAAEGLRK